MRANRFARASVNLLLASFAAIGCSSPPSGASLPAQPKPAEPASVVPGAVAQADEAPPAAEVAPVRRRGPRRAPNGERYPRPLPCPSSVAHVHVFAADLAALGIVGTSSEPDGGTPLAHHRSAVADLTARTIAELVRRRGAGLVRCVPDCQESSEPCGMFVTELYPDCRDGYTDGRVMPHNAGVPLHWAPSADWRTCVYATSEQGADATGVVFLQVGCRGCAPKER